ncbi:hypothetical protein LXL04_008744 [Taraxacum kok-saghyz]
MANATMMIIAMNQAIREQRGVFEVGDEVEVTGKEGDIEVPFYPGVITKLETVDIENIRPKPIDFRFKFKWGDYVDVWVRQRWCSGRYVSDVGRKNHHVFCLHLRRMKFLSLKKKMFGLR